MKRFAPLFLFPFLLFLLQADSISGQSPLRVSITVDHFGDDPVGRQLAAALEETIRTSLSYALDDPDKASVTVEMASIDVETTESAKGTHSAVAVVITMRNQIPVEKGNPQTWLPIYLDSSVLACGANRVNSMARSILAEVDRALEKYRSESRKIGERFQGS